MWPILLLCAAVHAQTRSTSKPAAAIDPCTLVTRQEAAAAVGEPVGDGKSTVVDTKGNPTLEGGGSCAYDSPSSVHYIKVNMYRYPASIAAAYRKRCAQKEQVPGVVDVACWYDSDRLP